MKILHTADLHLGKKLNEYNMIELQKDALTQITNIVHQENIDVVVIAGDIYQSSIPTIEAIQLFDRFLTSLLPKKVIIVAGNHDSRERLNYGREIFQKQGIYLFCEHYDSLEKITFQDEYGDVDFYIWPFIGVYSAKAKYKEETYNLCFKRAVMNTSIEYTKRNCFIGHSFYSNHNEAKTSDSEWDIAVGTAEVIDPSCIESFEVAMFGHLHNPQKVLKPTFRYSGSLLKYSFSEIDSEKSIVIYELNEKGKEVNYKLIPLNKSIDLEIKRGLYKDIITQQPTDNLLQIILEDNDVLDQPMKLLKKNFPNILELKYGNLTRYSDTVIDKEMLEKKTTYELFVQFYEASIDRKITDDEKTYLQKKFTEIEEEEQR